MSVLAVSEEMARAIVQAIIADMTDRSGLQNEWEAIDADVQAEIRETWERIVQAGGKR